MIYNVLEATVKNDFVFTCRKYLKNLKIELDFEEIEKMTKRKFKKLLKEKTIKAALLYLNEQKEKQKKIDSIVHKTLKLQDYFQERKVEVSKVVFAARGKNLNIKTQKPWKYEDNICVGCKKRDESGDEVLKCEGFGVKDSFPYEFFFSENVEKQMKIGENMMKRLNNRKKLMDE